MATATALALTHLRRNEILNPLLLTLMQDVQPRRVLYDSFLSQLPDVMDINKQKGSPSYGCISQFLCWGAQWWEAGPCTIDWWERGKHIPIEMKLGMLKG